MAANISPLFALVNKHSVLIFAATGDKVTVMRYGERLRAARTFKDWTQAQLAEASKVSQSLISQLERSETATGSEYTVPPAPARDDDRDERVPCPFCAEKILPAAKVCKHCHAALPPPDLPSP